MFVRGGLYRIREGSYKLRIDDSFPVFVVRRKSGYYGYCW